MQHQPMNEVARRNWQAWAATYFNDPQLSPSFCPTDRDLVELGHCEPSDQERQAEFDYQFDAYQVMGSFAEYLVECTVSEWVEAAHRWSREQFGLTSCCNVRFEFCNCPF
jgi:hypothetical protein